MIMLGTARCYVGPYEGERVPNVEQGPICDRSDRPFDLGSQGRLSGERLTLSRTIIELLMKGRLKAMSASSYIKLWNRSGYWYPYDKYV